MGVISGKPRAAAPEEVLEALGVSAEKGISPQEAKRRIGRHGPNRLREAKRRSAWKILVDPFAGIVVLLLAAACVLSFAFGKPVEAVAILAVLLVNSPIGFFMEMRSVRSMESLRRMGRVEATVRRDGRIERVPAARLVPGDIVLVEGGDVVTADLRILTVAEKSTSDPEADPYGELTLLGLAGLLDPPRRNVREAVESCRRAGIRVIMVTGDHAATARSIRPRRAGPSWRR